MTAGDELELVLEPRSDRYGVDDDRWRDQVVELYRGLHAEVGGVRRERQAVPGTKGGLEQVVLALGSAGAFTAAIEFVRAWLGRDRTRSLDISWSVAGGERTTVSVRGDHIDQSALRAIAEAAGRRIGTDAQQAGSWPTPGTTLS